MASLVDEHEQCTRPSKRARPSTNNADMDLDLLDVLSAAQHHGSVPALEQASTTEPSCALTTINGTQCTPCAGHTSRELLKARLATFNATISAHPPSALTPMVCARVDEGLGTITEYASWFDRLIYRGTVQTEAMVHGTPVTLGSFHADVGGARAGCVPALDDKMRRHLDYLTEALAEGMAYDMSVAQFERVLEALMQAFDVTVRDEHLRHLGTLACTMKNITARLAAVNLGHG